jgi:hypothetical protein
MDSMCEKEEQNRALLEEFSVRTPKLSIGFFMPATSLPFLDGLFEVNPAVDAAGIF